MTLSMKATVVTMTCLAWLPAQAQQVYDVGNGVTAPRVVKRVMPARSLESDPVVRCTVTADGAVRDAEVVREGNGADDAAAVDAVAQWQFAPGRKDGEPVAVRFYIQFHGKTKPDGASR